MRLDEALYAHLTACPLAAVTALAALVSTRIYPAVAPQDAKVPCLTYDIGQQDEEQTHSGGVGIVQTTGSVTVEATEYADCRALAVAAKAAIEAPTQRWGDVRIWRVLVTAGTTPEFDDQTQTWVQALSIAVTHAKEA